MHCFPSLRRAHPRACSRGLTTRRDSAGDTEWHAIVCEDRRSNRSRRSCRRTHNHTTITMSSESDERAQCSVTYTIEWRCGDAVSFAQRHSSVGDCAHSALSRVWSISCAHTRRTCSQFVTSSTTACQCRLQGAVVSLGHSLTPIRTGLRGGRTGHTCRGAFLYIYDETSPSRISLGCWHF